MFMVTYLDGLKRELDKFVNGYSSHWLHWKSEQERGKYAFISCLWASPQTDWQCWTKETFRHYRCTHYVIYIYDSDCFCLLIKYCWAGEQTSIQVQCKDGSDFMKWTLILFSPRTPQAPFASPTGWKPMFQGTLNESSQILLNYWSTEIWYNRGCILSGKIKSFVFVTDLLIKELLLYIRGIWWLPGMKFESLKDKKHTPVDGSWMFF